MFFISVTFNKAVAFGSFYLDPTALEKGTCLKLDFTVSEEISLGANIIILYFYEL